MARLPFLFGGTKLVQGGITDLQQTTLLQIGRRHSPAALQVSVQTIGQHLTEGTVRVLAGLEFHFGVHGVKPHGQVQGLGDTLRQLVMCQSIGSRLLGCPVES